jgi:hypothetical protein
MRARLRQQRFLWGRTSRARYTDVNLEHVEQAPSTQRILCGLLPLAAVVASDGDELIPTDVILFAEVSPIFVTRCGGCHHPTERRGQGGGLASGVQYIQLETPFALRTPHSSLLRFLIPKRTASPTRCAEPIGTDLPEIAWRALQLSGCASCTRPEDCAFTKPDTDVDADNFACDDGCVAGWAATTRRSAVTASRARSPSATSCRDVGASARRPSTARTTRIRPR